MTENLKRPKDRQDSDILNESYELHTVMYVSTKQLLTTWNFLRNTSPQANELFLGISEYRFVRMI
jgi:hypothetical protein